MRGLCRGCSRLAMAAIVGVMVMDVVRRRGGSEGESSAGKTLIRVDQQLHPPTSPPSSPSAPVGHRPETRISSSTDRTGLQVKLHAENMKKTFGGARMHGEERGMWRGRIRGEEGRVQGHHDTARKSMHAPLMSADNVRMRFNGSAWQVPKPGMPVGVPSDHFNGARREGKSAQGRQESSSSPPHVSPAHPKPSAAAFGERSSPAFFHQVQLEEGNNMTARCVVMNAAGERPIICLHPVERDIHVSGELMRKGVWEAHLVHHFIKMLKSNRDAVVIDVGAQLGMYSLLAAKNGHRVLMVEPLTSNVDRILLSLKKNGMSSRLNRDVLLFKNTVADVAGKQFKTVTSIADNVGGTQWGEAGAKGGDTVTSITLDMLLPMLTGSKSLLMKLDIEGGECKAIQGARELFAGKRVMAVFMEFGQLKQQIGRLSPCSVSSSMQVLHDSGLTPFDPSGGKLSCCQDTDMRRWGWDVIWRRV